eukprot:m.71004 g.71004  ORF g.71004 m.71004 type:complete len:876 (+) comp14123_c0_seq3:1730-4357(+)
MADKKRKGVDYGSLPLSKRPLKTNTEPAAPNAAGAGHGSSAKPSPLTAVLGTAAAGSGSSTALSRSTSSSSPTAPQTYFPPPTSAEELDAQVLKFKNRQLAIQLRKRKEDIHLQESKCKQLDSQLDKCQAQISTLQTCWDQMWKDVSELLSRSEQSVGEPRKPTGEVKALVNALQRGVTAEDCNEAIQLRCRQTVDLVTRLVTLQHTMHESRAAAAAKLREESGGDSVLAQDNAKLHTEVSALKEQLAGQDKSACALKSECASLQNKLQQAQAKYQRLKDASDDKALQLEKTHNQLFRLRDKLGASEQKAAHAMQQIALVTPSPSPLGTSAQASVNSALGMDAQAAHALEDSLKAAEATSQIRQEECERLRKENEALQEANLALRSQPSAMSSGAVEQTPEYQKLYYSCVQWKRQAEQNRQEFEAKVEAFAKSEHARVTEVEQLRALRDEHKQQLHASIRELQDKLTHLSRENEQLKMTVERQKMTAEAAGNSQGNSELRKLLDSAKAQNKQLQTEISRLRATRPAEPGSGQASEEVTQLKAKLRASEESEKELKLLLGVYKTASKEVREKSELLVAERKLKDQLAELQQRVQDGTAGVPNSTDRIRDLEAKVTELMEARERDEEELVAEIETTGQALEDLQEQNARLLTQIKEKEDTKLDLMASNLRGKERYQLAVEEKTLLEARSAILQQEVQLKSAEIGSLNKELRALHEAGLDAQRKVHELEQRALAEKRRADSEAQAARDKQADLDNFGSRLEAVQAEASASIKKADQVDRKRQGLEEELASCKTKLDRFQGVSTSSSADEILQAEVSQLRKQLTCDCCKSAPKDTVLLRCFHVFCFTCVESLVKGRSRRCPACKEPFGAKEFHKVYLST